MKDSKSNPGIQSSIRCHFLPIFYGKKLANNFKLDFLISVFVMILVRLLKFVKKKVTFGDFGHRSARTVTNSNIFCAL